MTNVSKNLLFAFAILVSATMLSLGAFATTASAADDFGYSDWGGGGYTDFGSYDGYSDYGSYGGYTDYGSYDSYSDYGSYDGYSDYGGYDGYSDYGGYDSWSDYGSYDGYSDFGGYEEYTPGYTEEYTPGYTEEYTPGYTEEYTPGYTEEYTPGYTESYTPGYTESYTPGFTTGGGYTVGGGYQTGGGYSIPRTPTYTTPGCTSCYTPSYPTPRPTPGCTTCGGSNTNITNTNINTNTNTIIDNSIVDNSINDSFNTTVVGDNNVVAGGYQGIAIATQIPQPTVVAPYCVITLTNAGVYSAQATIVWSSQNATAAYITSIGSVSTSGTRSVTGYANQTYSLTVTGQGGSYTCHTQPFTPTYVPPTYQNPTVSLTQIPYTGLSMGPLGNAIYWLSLFSVAAAGAYLLVYYKGGVLALATASVANRRQNHFVVSENETEEIQTEVAPVTEETPTTNVFNFLPALVDQMTKDSMFMARSADGTPRIVISRA